MPTALWSPNQTAQAQVETYTFTAPSSIGNTYIATINGKSVTYSSISGDTAATVATGLFNLLNATDSVPPELLEITFTNPSSGVIVATANEPGTPFANVTVNGVADQGLVLSTGNGLANGITTTHTTANKSPSDVLDPQNWLRITAPAPGVRGIPVNGDDVIVSNSNTPLLWNLDRLSSVEFGTYSRWQDFTSTIGLPENNPNGYAEWRATYFKFNGPQGSVPSGGLAMTLGFSSGSGSGPTRERYDLQSSRVTLTILAAGSAQDEYGVRFKGVHTLNEIKLSGGVSLGLAMLPGETARAVTITVSEGSILGVGSGVTFTSGALLTMYGGTCLLNAVPANLTMENGAQVIVSTSDLTLPTATMRGGCILSYLAGGTITTLTMETGSSLDKSVDGRALTITNLTIDGDTCIVNDPLNCISYTNPVAINQRVTSGPFIYTGPRNMTLEIP